MRKNKIMKILYNDLPLPYPDNKPNYKFLKYFF